ncbi:WD40-repeat-containing domain protein [Lasiosphaeria hispida]|uniref:Probable cytosolic iron-sulfur protein assembly protein 1 n=1 Tax=Lasiosphaeria hispida TaxID=260671 RepID=A0AAJ0H9J8_9PEZI|nr:WD40-repeat-containing domain protein [Lasiosphaeria hispida]
MAPPTAAAAEISPLPPLHPDLCQRAWASVPHPTLPLLATPHATLVTVFSLATLSKHSVLSGGHARSVRAATWQPGLAPGKLRLVTGSFDATAGLWSWDGGMEREVTANGGEEEGNGEEWEFNLVLEGHENEVKGVAFNPSGQYLATCSRDKSVWIWEDVGVAGGDGEDDDGGEWETVAVLNEHEGDVKAVAWCPDVPGRTGHSRYSADVLATASYDNTVRIWREDSDGEWVCVSVLEGHDATVWGLQWEPKPKDDKTFPRLMTFSADATIRVWTLQQDEEDEEAERQEASSNAFRPAWGGIPNTMRRELREEWECTAILPKAHTREVYSATWSAGSSLVASTGSDGIIALYGEGSPEEDVEMASDANLKATPGSTGLGTNGWRLLATVADGHGSYEINHITWCRRFDAGTDRKGEEEMLITTGDDGVIRPWQVRIS